MDVPPVALEVDSIRSHQVKVGEPLDFTMRVVNHTNSDQSPLVWLDAYLSGDRPFPQNPLIQPRTLRIRAHQQVEVPVRIPVPGHVRPGSYTLHLCLSDSDRTLWDTISLPVRILAAARERMVVCKVCGMRVDTEQQQILEVDQICLVRCPQCGIVFNPALMEEWTEGKQRVSLWLADQFDAGTFQAEAAYYRHLERRLVFEQEVARIQWALQQSRGLQLLDFGCGTGGFLMVAQQHAMEVYGIEVNRHVVNFVRDRGLFPIFSSVDEARDHLGTSRLDVVVIIHTLEHVADPIAVLKSLGHLLRPDGLMVVVVPEFNLLTRHLGSGLLRARWMPAVVTRSHRFYFCRTTLAACLQRAGYTAIQFYPTILGGRVSRQLGGRVPPCIERAITAPLGLGSLVSHTLHLELAITAYARWKGE